MEAYKYNEVVALLKQLIAIQSLSREEDQTAGLIDHFLVKHGVASKRLGNNIYAYNKHYNPSLPTILLNSHHDTVKPGSKWIRDPFKAIEEGDKLFGLGSNDAGGPLVSLMATFLYYYDKPLKYNLILAATAEEEISGRNRIELLLPELGKIAFGIVGEPTLMQMATAEKGLMVLDCVAYGKTGHAARDEGENAIYNAMKDLEWFRAFEFPSQSTLLGKIKMTVTQIEAGLQHNVVPDACSFVVDVRTNDKYTNEEIYEIVKANVDCTVTPRSFRLNSSGIAADHPIVESGLALGLTTYGSPTLSDQALMSFPTVKIGPGDSARSHTPDEYIKLTEIEHGIATYIDLLKPVIL